MNHEKINEELVKGLSKMYSHFLQFSKEYEKIMPLVQKCEREIIKKKFDLDKDHSWQSALNKVLNNEDKGS